MDSSGWPGGSAARPTAPGASSSNSISIPCDLCGGREAVALSVRSRSGAPLRTVICRRCGLVWSDPRPHDVKNFYEERYRLNYKGVLTPKLKHVRRAGLTALSRLSRLRASLPPSGASVLDVGSGGGEFIYLMQRLGYAVKGVEPNRGYAEYSRAELGLDVSVGFAGEVDLPSDLFDVVTIWHVLEHTEAPVATLERLRATLKPGGLLAVEVPNVEALSHSPKSSFHEAHLYNFNVETLRLTAVKAGFSDPRTSLSPDGGNVMLTARRPATPSERPAELSFRRENFRSIHDLVVSRSTIRHFFTRWPYVRLLGKLTRSLAEGLDAFRRGGNAGRKRLLDDLYAERLKLEPATAVSGALSGEPF